MTPPRAKNATRKTKRSPGGGRLHPAATPAKQLSLPPPFPQPWGDEEGAGAAPLTIFTIGHSNHDPCTFLSLVQLHHLTAIVDVRSAPYSRYAPHFNRDCLDQLLETARVRYLWCGDTLGGRPDDPACYPDGIVRKGNVDYTAVAAQAWYRDGIRLLLDIAARGTTAVLCSEEDPRRCHRHRLIEPSLRDLGIIVQHIRKDGSLETIEPGEEAQPDRVTPQLALFGIEQ